MAQFIYSFPAVVPSLEERILGFEKFLVELYRFGKASSVLSQKLYGSEGVRPGATKSGSPLGLIVKFVCRKPYNVLEFMSTRFRHSILVFLL